ALNTRQKAVIVKVLKVLQALVTCDQGPDGQGLIGQALVPYYRQILPVLNIFIRQNGQFFSPKYWACFGNCCPSWLAIYHRNLLGSPPRERWSTKERAHNLGDGIDYGQQRRENLGELIMETLEAFEVNGGEDAFINIKYLVPVFQSVVVS
ncbi:unnamed protein product, partial [Hapterophycus canaliculatus]